MRSIAVTLTFLAWLLHGAMPAMAGHPMSMTSGTMAAALDHPHAEPVATAKPCHASASSPSDCPHSGDLAAEIFCSACLVLPPVALVSPGGCLAFAHGARVPAPGMKTVLRAPLDPPPRA